MCVLMCLKLCLKHYTRKEAKMRKNWTWRHIISLSESSIDLSRLALRCCQCTACMWAYLNFARSNCSLSWICKSGHINTTYMRIGTRLKNIIYRRKNIIREDRDILLATTSNTKLNGLSINHAVCRHGFMRFFFKKKYFLFLKNHGARFRPPDHSMRCTVGEPNLKMT